MFIDRRVEEEPIFDEVNEWRKNKTVIELVGTREHKNIINEASSEKVS